MPTKKKMILSVVVVILINVFIVYFIILPTVNDIQEISDAVYRERIDLEKKYQRGQLLNKTLENFEQVKAQRGKIGSAFIIEGSELLLVTSLETIAEKNSLAQEIRLDSKKVAESKNLYQSQKINIALTGKYGDLRQYLHEIERMPYTVNVFDISWTTPEKIQPANAILTMTLDGKIYSLPKPKKQ